MWRFSKILLGQVCPKKCAANYVVASAGQSAVSKLFRNCHDIEAKDGSEEVSFGTQGHVFDGEVVDSADHQLESAVIEANAEARDALRMSAS